MNYAKVENGQVIQIGLPLTGTLKDGSTVSGYNFLPESVLIAEGWLPLVDNRPEYNPETQYLVSRPPTILKDHIIANYEIQEYEAMQTEE